MAKFKIGDKVRVRLLLLGTEVDGLTVYNEHTAMQGVQTIRYVDRSASAYLLNGSWLRFSEGMLEKVGEEEKVSESKWAEVAAIFGLQLEEEFDIEDDAFNPHRFTERGLLDQENELRNLCAIELIGGGYKKIIKRPFKPGKGENYWYVPTDGDVHKTYNSHMEIDYYYITSGNCYRTREEAEAHVEEWKEKYKEFCADVNE